jgi:hypothetical protein
MLSAWAGTYVDEVGDAFTKTLASITLSVSGVVIAIGPRGAGHETEIPRVEGVGDR